MMTKTVCESYCCDRTFDYISLFVRMVIQRNYRVAIVGRTKTDLESNFHDAFNQLHMFEYHFCKKTSFISENTIMFDNSSRMDFYKNGPTVKGCVFDVIVCIGFDIDALEQDIIDLKLSHLPIIIMNKGIMISHNYANQEQK